MALMILGIVLFFGVHSVRIVSDDFRSAQIARLGERRYKGIYSAVSLVGIVLVGSGFSMLRRTPVVLWNPPEWMHPITSLLVLVAFVLWTAAYVPGNRIKAIARQPFAAGTKTWAFAHLLSNGSAADVLLFGSFLVWAIFAFVSAQRRDRRAGVVYAVGPRSKTVTTIAIGLVVWVVFGFWLHGWLFGVKPM
jgi:uncharacterized membrane protein